MSAANRRFWGILAAGIFVGVLLIQLVSRPDATGGGARFLNRTELKPGPGIVVQQGGHGVSLQASLPAASAPLRILELSLPEGFASNFRSYALAGEVSYRTPEESQGYLEAVSVSSPGAAFPVNSRTQGTGLQAPLSGHSLRRSFALPFSLPESDAVPVSLELNLVLPAGGAVELSSLQLVEGWGSRPGAWCSMEENSRFGAILGALIGLWGTLLGIGRVIWRERANGPVLASCVLWTLGGALCLLALSWACAAGQPWWIRQQFALCGVLLVALAGAFLGWAQLRLFPGEIREPSASSPVPS